MLIVVVCYRMLVDCCFSFVVGVYVLSVGVCNSLLVVVVCCLLFAVCLICVVVWSLLLLVVVC